jgi:WD40 repeat protein
MPGGDPEVRTLAEALGPITASVWTPDRKTWISAHDDGRIRVWSVDDRALRLTLIALTDGSWVVDRPDGSRYASESLRDGTSPLLYRPPPR